MRKLIVFIVIMVAAVSSIGVCHAAVIEDEDVSPQYVGTMMHFESLENKFGTELIYYGQITPKSVNSYDKVKATLNVVNFATGSTVHSETMTVYYDSLGGYFMASSSCDAPVIGTYYLDVTYKCYKNGTLIETITGQSKLLSI